ncbi:hypothetical protein [Lysinibacillus capsici]|uniref:hypothetical protein n=1 Tax=Lysinibacillus capsici TaxID=2115968 RepID=UPI0030821F7D|nr:hypothetical protein ICJ70_13265 [Lysinibacillus capsici]
MDIYSALDKITWKKKEYFLYKHDLFVLKEKPSEEDFCKSIQVKSLAYMKKWEKTEEYRQLVSILIESRIAEDLEQIYYSLRVKAHDGDEKAIKMLLELQKTAKEYQKPSSVESFAPAKSETKSAIDELEL